MPVTQARQIFASFRKRIRSGRQPPAAGSPRSTSEKSDVVINVGNKLQHNSRADRRPRPEAHRHADRQLEHGQRNEHGSPLVADVAYGWMNSPRGRAAAFGFNKKENPGEKRGSAPLSRQGGGAARAGGENPEWERSRCSPTG